MYCELAGQHAVEVHVCAQYQVGVANYVHLLVQIGVALIGSSLSLDQQIFLIQILTIERQGVVYVLHRVEVIFAINVYDYRYAILVQLVGHALYAVLQEEYRVILAQPIHIHDGRFGMLRVNRHKALQASRRIRLMVVLGRIGYGFEAVQGSQLRVGLVCLQRGQQTRRYAYRMIVVVGIAARFARG